MLATVLVDGWGASVLVSVVLRRWLVPAFTLRDDPGRVGRQYGCLPAGLSDTLRSDENVAPLECNRGSGQLLVPPRVLIA